MSIKVVGEIGANHLGKIESAKQHIDIFSSFSGLKYFKFQKRSVDDLLTPEERTKPHPIPYFAHGNTYYEHRKALELDIHQHRELYEYCQDKNLVYACSAWDCNAARELVEHIPEMEYLKIPSAANLNFPMMKYIVDYSNCDLHISLGMTTSEEIDSIFEFILKLGAEKRTVMYWCTSSYPAEFSDLYLLEIKNLRQKCGHAFKAISYSDHSLGITAPIIAATLGATWIEKHIVLNRTIRHNDAASSLEPDGARRLVRDLHNLEQALAYKEQMSAEELEQRQKLKRIA